MICSRATHRKCKVGNVDQPDSEFINDYGKITRTCAACREDQRRWNNRCRTGGDVGFGMSVTHISPVDILKPGKPPKFSSEWEKKSHEEWLRGLVGSVQRSP